MVDEADIYIGLYAWRYGHVPAGHDISITDMEFNRAVERGIPILVFTMHRDHPLTLTMVEADKDAQDKLTQLKERAGHGRGRLEFRSPVELRSHIIQSLGALLKEEEAATQEKRAPSFHPPNLIPTAPEPYITHPYSLLQTREVVGRRAELNLLTECNLSGALLFSGHLREAETAACRALGIFREQDDRFAEGGSLQLVGLVLAACGVASPSSVSLGRSLNIDVAQKNTQSEGLSNAYLAQRCLWLSQPGKALPLAQRAWELAHVQRHERDFIRAARLHGEAVLGSGDLPTATERLYHALPVLAPSTSSKKNLLL